MTLDLMTKTKNGIYDSETLKKHVKSRVRDDRYDKKGKISTFNLLYVEKKQVHFAKSAI